MDFEYCSPIIPLSLVSDLAGRIERSKLRYLRNLQEELGSVLNYLRFFVKKYTLDRYWSTSTLSFSRPAMLASRSPVLLQEQPLIVPQLSLQWPNAADAASNGASAENQTAFSTKSAPVLLLLQSPFLISPTRRVRRDLRRWLVAGSRHFGKVGFRTTECLVTRGKQSLVYPWGIIPDDIFGCRSLSIGSRRSLLVYGTRTRPKPDCYHLAWPCSVEIGFHYCRHDQGLPAYHSR